jgi:ubiquinone/menaquinone biosynthesis C-methylase UbiE
MDKETINTYNKMAKDYDLETEDFWKRFPHTFLDKFIELSGQKIIDIGSGPGRDGLLLQGAGKDVVCLDASEAMIKISSDKGLRSILGDFNDLPFEDQSFDAVWSYTALLHVPKRSIDIPLKEISRVIRHSGVFALGLIEGNTEEYKESSGVNMPRWFSFYEKDEVIELCKRYDFELVYFETFKPRTKNYLNFIFRKS